MVAVLVHLCERKWDGSKKIFDRLSAIQVCIANHHGGLQKEEEIITKDQSNDTEILFKVGAVRSPTLVLDYRVLSNTDTYVPSSLVDHPVLLNLINQN